MSINAVKLLYEIDCLLASKPADNSPTTTMKHPSAEALPQPSRVYMPTEDCHQAISWLQKHDNEKLTIIRGLQDALRKANEPAFKVVLHLLLALFVEHVLEKQLGKTTLVSLGFHYTSEALGEWFRIKAKFNSNQYTLGSAAKRLYEDLYNVLPREDNLILSERSNDAVQFVFADTEDIETKFETRSPDGFAHTFTVGHNLLSNLDTLRAGDKWYDFLKSSNYDLETPITLSTEDVVELDKLFKEIAPETRKFIDVAETPNATLYAQLLLSTFFYHLHIDIPSNYAVIIVPLLLEDIGQTPDANLARTPGLPSANATLIFKKEKVPSDREMKQLEHALRYLTARLAACEVAAYGRSDRTDLVEVENVVRQCAVLKTHVLDRVNAAKHELKELLKPHCEGGEYPSESVDTIMKTTAAASDRYLELIRDIDYFAKRGVDGPKLVQGRSIFFFSEPGCGKETLAQLVHLLSGRSYDDSSHVVRDHLRKNNEEIGRYDKSMGGLRDNFSLLDAGKKLKDGMGLTSSVGDCSKDYFLFFGDPENANVTSVLESQGLGWICHRQANYFVLNCGLLDKDNFDEVMFGRNDDNGRRAGVILRAHLLGGTVFLDEFNTMPPPLANKLLRVLESPYQMLVAGATTAGAVNVQFVFGSNRTPEGLERDGFNSAVISRITKTYVQVPPLRERKEDIAVVVHKWILEAVEQRNDHAIKNLKTINLDALRLICEQPWPRNYRGLSSFVDDLLRQRTEQDMRSSEISFQEVLRCLRRRRVFQESARS